MGVPGTEGVQNGVRSDVYERINISKKSEKGRGEMRGKKKERRKKMRRVSLDPSGSGLSHFKGDFLKF